MHRSQLQCALVFFVRRLKKSKICLKLLRNSPGQPKAIVSRSPSTEFVDYHQRMRSSTLNMGRLMRNKSTGGVQYPKDVSSVKHFGHEGRDSPLLAVASTNAGQNGIHYPDGGRRTGYKTPYLCHNSDQANLHRNELREHLMVESLA